MLAEKKINHLTGELGVTEKIKSVQDQKERT